MEIDGHRRSGRNRFQQGRLPTPEQHAAAFEQALEWRQAWRAEVASRREEKYKETDKTLDRPKNKPKDDRAKFAAQIAQAEFGRFYRDAKAKLALARSGADGIKSAAKLKGKKNGASV